MEDFHLLMDDLGNLLDTTLIPDKLGACVLNFDDEISVQIEPDAAGHNLILAANIGEIPAGKFRENLLATGLKYNAIYPRIGTFAYLARKNLLVFFHTLKLEGLQADLIAATLPPFMNLAKLWKQDVAKGVVPVIEIESKQTKPSIFDLHK